MDKGKIDFGELIHQLRSENGLSQKKVANKLGIDISLLSKIEHGERQLQGHMLKPLADLFKLDFKEIQIQFLNQRIRKEFGSEPFFLEAINEIKINL